ncbi:MAG: NAD(P)/FAD-dependent oxidoreductase [Phycisphaerales bacterium]
MGRVIVLGAGISGHTAALFLQRHLGKRHEVVVVSPRPNYNWIPSNIWVGIGVMKPTQVLIDLHRVYKKVGIDFRQAAATAIWPEGGKEHGKPFVEFVYTDDARKGQTESLEYDYLINATGPKLNFDATTGLNPLHGHNLSVCTPSHAVEASEQLTESIERMRRGERQKFVIGTGHGQSTCQGAAFEYALNLEFMLRQKNVREMADITWLSNEYCLADFGMGGFYLKQGGYVTHSKIFAESLYKERGLKWILQAHTKEVDCGQIHYMKLSGEEFTEKADFMMLIPSFSGVGLEAFDRAGNSIKDKLFAPNGFMRVDADYTPRDYAQWSSNDWPSSYQNTDYTNIYAIGIAFAPPHAISRPHKSPDGTPIFATAPRTGMPSAMIGKAVAETIADRIQGKDRPAHCASMAKMGAACIASAGASHLKGTAVSMTVFPIIPDFESYPEYGRDLRHTSGEIGLAGHWIKSILHHMFIYKAKAKPGWWLIPE